MDLMDIHLSERDNNYIMEGSHSSSDPQLVNILFDSLIYIDILTTGQVVIVNFISGDITTIGRFLI